MFPLWGSAAIASEPTSTAYCDNGNGAGADDLLAQRSQHRLVYLQLAQRFGRNFAPGYFSFPQCAYSVCAEAHGYLGDTSCFGVVFCWQRDAENREHTSVLQREAHEAVVLRLLRRSLLVLVGNRLPLGKNAKTVFV